MEKHINLNKEILVNLEKKIIDHLYITIRSKGVDKPYLNYSSDYSLHGLLPNTPIVSDYDYK